MRVRHRRGPRPMVVAGLVGLAALGLAPGAWAQEHTADPYKPYNGAYEQFVYPTYPNGLGYVPNQGVLTGRSGTGRANQFQNFVDDLDGGGLGDEPGSAPRRSGPGVPYYQ